MGSINQPRVSLEGEIGATLFVRSQAGLTPTEAGRIAIARAGEVERRIDRMTEQISDSAGGAAGSLYLRGNHWVLKRLIDYGMADLFAQNPNLDLRTVDYYSEHMLNRGTTVSVWFERNPRNMEFAVKLGSVPYAVYAKAGENADALDWLGLLDEEARRRTPAKATEPASGQGLPPAGHGNRYRPSAQRRRQRARPRLAAAMPCREQSRPGAGR